MSDKQFELFPGFTRPPNDPALNPRPRPPLTLALTPSELEEDDDWRDDSCERCCGEGEILVCIDDMCRGLGYCIHGDGEIVCPSCRGTGLTL